MTASLRLRSDAPLKNAVVMTRSDAEVGLQPGPYSYMRNGASHPAQITQLADGSLLAGLYIDEHSGSAEAQVELQPVEDGQGRGIELSDQPENGRVVVNYSGFVQTIYHYGRDTFKPRFYPITAPCARMGAIDAEETVYPKGITDDSPPDHIWHRSLWYACGDVNGIDFYLENGGEGRIEHRRFADIFSGPVFGGFTEELRWVTPDSQELIADRRTFTLYRLKGAIRVFDISAEFTALQEPVTFGQTNENALPLIRVADAIDEWDGGRITLADGSAGGRECFGRRAEWADCSGPLVDKPGTEPGWWGIAMLDHPDNRGHPNAWFARSYGPLGTNLPFFDGPLTLQPGETWQLRHRIIVHEGTAQMAEIPRRFDEYAKPAVLTSA